MTEKDLGLPFQLIEEGICSGITNCVSACKGKGLCCQGYTPRFSLLELGLLSAYDPSLVKKIIQKGTPVEIYGFDPTKENRLMLAFRLGEKDGPCSFLSPFGCTLPYEVRTLPCRTYLCLRGKYQLFLQTSHYGKYKKMVRYIEKYDQYFYTLFVEILDTYRSLLKEPLDFTKEPWLDHFLPVLIKESREYNTLFHKFLLSNWDPDYKPELHYHYTFDKFWTDMEGFTVTNSI
ncbi:YkgJ family cysteine cluster protein [Anaerosolibacter sp.]|uniref:YkgJ family cysteine cluster protein n=1 Tax=Anaerosolibacter sp. TaxID=1872527 RepID=UPI0039EDEC5F